MRYVKTRRDGGPLPPTRFFNGFNGSAAVARPGASAQSSSDQPGSNHVDNFDILSLSLSLSAARPLPITCSRFSLRFPIHCHTTTPPPALSRLLRLLQAYAFPWRVGMRAESFPSAQRYVLQTLSGPVPFTGGSQGNTAWGNNKTHTHTL